MKKLLLGLILLNVVILVRAFNHASSFAQPVGAACRSYADCDHGSVNLVCINEICQLP